MPRACTLPQFVNTLNVFISFFFSFPEEISRIKPDTSDLEDIEEEDEVQGHEHKHGAVNADAATSSGK